MTGSALRVRRTQRILANAILWGALVCVALVVGPAQARTAIVDVKLAFEGVDGGPRGTPRWRVATTPAKIEAQLGVLSAGDSVRFRIASQGSRRIGLWLQDDRYFARRSCRTSWFRKKCKDIYETRTCRIEDNQDPVSGDLRLSIEVQPYASGAGDPGATASPKTVATLGGGRREADHEVMGSRRLVLSGAFRTKPLVCRRLRGEARGNPVRRRVLGERRPETFFQLLIEVDAPPLQD